MGDTPTADDVLSVLRREKSRLEGEYPLHAMWLFGSVARGDADESSDVDILVDVDPNIGLGFVNLAEELERILERPIDLVSIRAVREDLLRRIGEERLDV